MNTLRKVKHSFGLEGGVKPQFFEMSSKYSEETAVEIKKKEKPGINDVFDAYKKLLQASEGKILVLLDEAGSLTKSFFNKQGETSLFEVMLNQLRTAEYIRD